MDHIFHMSRVLSLISLTAAAAVTNQIAGYKDESYPETYKKVLLTIVDLAAIKIQAFFRGHLVCVCDPLRIHLYAMLCTLKFVCMYNTGKVRVPGIEEPSEATGIGAWRVRAKTGENCHPLHEGNGAAAGQDSREAAPEEL